MSALAPTTDLPVRELRRISAHMGATTALLDAAAFLNAHGKQDAAQLLISNVNTLQQRAISNVMERTK